MLGVQGVGAGIGELSAVFSLAIEMGARLEDVAATIHAHPIQSEGFHEGALIFYFKLCYYSYSRYLGDATMTRSILPNCERCSYKAAVMSAMAGSVFNPECMHV